MRVRSVRTKREILRFCFNHRVAAGRLQEVLGLLADPHPNEINCNFR